MVGTCVDNLVNGVNLLATRLLGLGVVVIEFVILRKRQPLLVASVDARYWRLEPSFDSSGEVIQHVVKSVV